MPANVVTVYELPQYSNDLIPYQHWCNHIAAITALVLHGIFIYRILSAQTEKRLFVAMQYLLLAQSICEFLISIRYLLENYVSKFCIAKEVSLICVLAFYAKKRGRTLV